jgi:hypothetical protein
MLCGNNPRKGNISSGVRAFRLENGDFGLLMADAHDLEERISENIQEILADG